MNMKGYIFQIVGFMIFSSVIMHILPGKDYEKYFRLFNGIVLFIIIVNPLIEAGFPDENTIMRMITIENAIQYDEQVVGKAESSIMKNMEEHTERIIDEILKEKEIYTRNISVTVNEEKIDGVIIELKLSCKNRCKEAKLLINESLEIEQSRIEVR